MRERDNEDIGASLMENVERRNPVLFIFLCEAPASGISTSCLHLVLFPTNMEYMHAHAGARTTYAA